MKIKFDLSQKSKNEEEFDFKNKNKINKYKVLIILGITIVLYVVFSIVFKHVAGGSLWPFDDKMISNVWVISCKDKNIKVFYDNKEHDYKLSNEATKDYSRSVCDIGISGKKVTKIVSKPNSIDGKIKSIGNDYIEIDGCGKASFADKMRLYETGKGVSELKLADIKALKGNIKCVLEDDKICAVLINERPYKNTYINVIIKSTGFSSLFQSNVVLSCKNDMLVKYKTSATDKKYNERIIKKGSKFRIGDYEAYAKKGVVVSDKTNKNGVYIDTVSRDAKNVYKGEMIIKKYDGKYLLINRLNLEEYLCGVVPSEMPSSYGEEALKVQAVCARTYAYMQMSNKKYKKYGADVDDSTSFQVYNNQSTDIKTRKAVIDTRGRVLKYNNKLITTYYYSTSCGYTSSATECFSGKNEHKTIDKYIYGKLQSVKDGESIDLTKETTFRNFIDKSCNKDCFEKDCSWYRWSVNISKGNMTRMINNNLYKAEAGCIKVLKNGKYVEQNVSSVGNVVDINISKRLTGGLSGELLIKGSDKTIKVCAQYSIRAVLGPIYDDIVKADKKKVNFSLLPSGYFYIDKTSSGYRLVGGGFGHGAGMSQDGAMKLGELGKSYEQILDFYFKNTNIEVYN